MFLAELPDPNAPIVREISRSQALPDRNPTPAIHAVIFSNFFNYYFSWVAAGIKLIEVACIHVFMATYADRSEIFYGLNFNAVALIGIFCTALKLWLFVAWFPIYVFGALLPLWVSTGKKMV